MSLEISLVECTQEVKLASLLGKSEDFILDAFLFAGNEPLVRDVMVGGRWVVQEGRHAEEEAILAGYKDALQALTA